MDSTASLLLLGAAVVAVIGTLGIWQALKRPAQALQRRRRDAALGAAANYTPAERVPPYGPPPDPCAPGLSDAERVGAMRAMLLRSDRHGGDEPAAPDSFAPTQPLDPRDVAMTTSPMAWNPRLESDETLVPERQRSRHRGSMNGSDREHITI